MIRYFITALAEKRVTEVAAPQKDCWVHLEAPTAAEISEVARLTHIPEDFLYSATDEEEAPHLDADDDAHLAVIDIPKMTQEDGTGTISTVPLALVYNSNYLVSVCMTSTTVLTDFFEGKIKNVEVARRMKTIYQIMMRNTTRFLYYLRQIDKASDRIQKGLSKSMQNKELLQLVELQKSLVFFSASIAANHAVIQKLHNQYAAKSVEDEHDLLEDIVIESKQAIGMCTVYREIIKSTMDAFAAVVNNNQNLIMKLLTAITIILSIPMVISGFWGMNTAVPGEGSIWGFVITVGFSIAISAVVFIIMSRKKMM